jgi:hypothetical protein
MTEGANERVPPNFPQPPPQSSMPSLPPAFATSPPPSSMPPPVPGTGAGSHVQHAAAQAFQAGNMPYYPVADKSVGVAYLLWFFLGWAGVHHFYLGKFGRGVGYLFTFAWFTIGWWIDLFTLPAKVKRVNFERRAGLR